MELKELIEQILQEKNKLEISLAVPRTTNVVDQETFSNKKRLKFINICLDKIQHNYWEACPHCGEKILRDMIWEEFSHHKCSLKKPQENPFKKTA